MSVHRFMDFSNLPSNWRGVEWGKCKNIKLYFEYDDIKGFLKIIEYNKKTRCIKFEYDSNIYKTSVNLFREGYIGDAIGKRTHNFKYEIGDIINNLTIVDKFNYRNAKNETYKTYRCKCKKCNYEVNIIESNLLKGSGCPCCSNKVVVPGINDIATTDPWMIKYLVNPEDAFRYSSQSHKKIKIKCVYCGKEKHMKISDLYRYQKVTCICSDNISYPEKVMFGILEQIDIDFIYQLNKSHMDWCKNYRYDFYIPSLNLIIEMDGGFHNRVHAKEKRSIQEIKNIDREKNKLAMNNNKKIIRIDCDYIGFDRCDYIKNQILKSHLNKYIHMDKINWTKVNEFALSNRIKVVCDYYNKHKEDMIMSDIANNFKCSVPTIRHYLKTGNKFGWCDYSPTHSRKTVAKLKKCNNAKRIKIIELNMTFESVSDCIKYMLNEKHIKLSHACISNVCNNKQENHKGYHFEYVS